MKRYIRLFEKDYKMSALNKLRALTTSGGKKGFSNFSKDELNWLSQTVKKDLKLYRGIGLIRSRIDTLKIDEIKQLKVGDPLPAFLYKEYNKFVSYSKKKSVAKYYSEGAIGIVVESLVNKDAVIVDLENLRNIIDFEQDIFDEEDFDYFKIDKEVLIDENKLKSPPTIILKKGNKI